MDDETVFSNKGFIEEPALVLTVEHTFIAHDMMRLDYTWGEATESEKSDCAT